MRLFEIYPFASFLVLTVFISGRVIFLKGKGISVSSGAAKNKKSLISLYLLFLMILLLWLFEIAKPAFQISISILPETITNLLTDSFFLKIAGVSVITMALISLVISILHFKDSLRFGINENNRGKLITSGIFSISRNPFFLSLDLYFLGIALLMPNIFFLGLSVLSVVCIHFFILKEEKFMMKVYGEEYAKYAKKVRRYF